MEVFSNPVCPMAMDFVGSTAAGHQQQLQPAEKELDFDDLTFVEQFLNAIPSNDGLSTTSQSPDQQSNTQSMTCLHLPPEQPLFDSFPYETDQGVVSPSSSSIVKQEAQSGFLSTWSHLTSDNLPDDFNAMEIDQCSPEDRKRFHTSLVKEELHCKIKLKLLQEGKDIDTHEVTDNQPSVKEYEVSEETKVMQQKRKEKNREAAKKCRQKKKQTELQQEMKIRSAEKQIQQMKHQLEAAHRDFSNLLEYFPDVPCFLTYLKLNRHLLKNPVMRTSMQKFVRNHRESLSGGGSAHAACSLSRPAATQLPTSQPTMGFGSFC